MNLVWYGPAIVVVTLLLGCGGGTSPTGVSPSSYKAIRALSMGYDGYLKQNKGQPPQDEQALRTYLESRQSDWDSIGVHIDDMFISPRSGEPFVVIYGSRPRSANTRSAYIAYEKTPVEGRRLMIAARGVYEEVDEAKFQSLIPDGSSTIR